MERKVRVRFAPSPTGALHIGGVRTALYNYLFARKHGGDFILRIEDTDQKRYVAEAEEYIQNALKWFGFDLDEGPDNGGDCGPYRQSERKETYRQYADQLVEQGHAYYAFDTPEELDVMRERGKAAKVPNPQYDLNTRTSMRNALTLSEDEVNKLMEEGVPHVVRLKMPRNEEIRFEDTIRGWIVVNSSNLDDKVIYKSDGMPTYHLANIADDHAMGITHVIRGEEWLPSAPTHILLYRYLGWEAPAFAHLPLILRPDGNGKLSKRDGAKFGVPVFPFEWKEANDKTGETDTFSGFKEDGYFPEAVTNAIVFLGWNPGTTQEIFSLDELIESFSLERVNKAGAKFDVDKIKWFNQQYLRAKNHAELARLLRPTLPAAYSSVSDEFLEKVCELMKERATFISDILEGTYFFEGPSEYDEKTLRKKWKENTPALMEELMGRLEATEPFSSETVEVTFKGFLEEKELGFGAVLPNLRLLVTGSGMGPSMFEIAALLGKAETLERMKTGLSRLSSAAES